MARILIAGGGVAGAATALALQQVGVESVVYEAHPTGGEDAGAFLTVMANGMAALDTIGAAEAVDRVSYPAGAVAVFDSGGGLIQERPISGPARTLRRAVLYRALQELAVARGIPVEHGKRLARASSGEGVRLEFADGTTAEGDILVGADGIHSVTRRLIDPGAPEPRFTGQHVVYGYAPGNPAGCEVGAYHMIFGSKAFFGFTAPGDGRTWWFARLGGEAGAKHDWRRLVLDAVRDDGSPAAAIVSSSDGEDDAIASSSDGEIVGGDAYDIPSTPRWRGHRMVLTGDAVHAASPAAAQGASMALEDAVALAGALAAHPDDPDAAFAAYEAERRPRTEETVAASARLVADHPGGDVPHSR
jgi:2-polyprenyl-6-methoxyphenol hydroxylase-like FAD-dependent oxidoreductase